MTTAGPITAADFARVDIRIGAVTRAEPHPQARKPALKLPSLLTKLR
jgi:tRNA-binding protein